MGEGEVTGLCFHIPLLRIHDLKSQLDNLSKPPLPQLPSKDGKSPSLVGWGGMKGAVGLRAHPPKPGTRCTQQAVGIAPVMGDLLMV